MSNVTRKISFSLTNINYNSSYLDITNRTLRYDVLETSIANHNWKSLRREMPWALPIHIYGFSCLFFMMAFYTFFSILNLRSQISARPFMSTINVLLFLTGVSRACVLLIDSYSSVQAMPSFMVWALWDVGYPSILSAFSLIQLAFTQLTQMKLRPELLWSKPTMSVLISGHFFLVLGADLVAAFDHRLELAREILHVVFAVWGLILCTIFLIGGVNLLSLLETLPTAIFPGDEASENKAAAPGAHTPKIKITDENDQTVSYVSDLGSKVSSQPTLDTIESNNLGDPQGRNSHTPDDVTPGPSGTSSFLDKAESENSFDTTQEEYSFPDPATLTFRNLNRSDEEDESFCEEKEIDQQKPCLSKWDSATDKAYDPTDLTLKLKQENSDAGSRRKKSLTWSEDMQMDSITENKENGGTSISNNNIPKEKNGKKNNSDKHNKAKNKKDTNKCCGSAKCSGRKCSNSSHVSSRRSSCIETGGTRKNSDSDVQRKGSYCYDSRKTNYNWEKSDKKKSHDHAKKNRSNSHSSEPGGQKLETDSELLVRKTGRSFSSAKDSRRCNRGGGDDQEEDSLLGFNFPTDVTLTSIINHIAYMNQATSNSKISSKLKESRKRQVKQVLLVAYVTAILGSLLSIAMLVSICVEFVFKRSKPNLAAETITFITPTWAWLLLQTICRSLELVMGCTMANITRQPVNRAVQYGYGRRMSSRNSLYI